VNIQARDLNRFIFRHLGADLAERARERAIPLLRSVT
jgi:hypothetical protein